MLLTVYRGPATWLQVQADAFELPFRCEAFDVIVADPPYEGATGHKRGVSPDKAGYIMFRGRDWFHEAMRVLKPSGHLYIVAAIREIGPWIEIAGEPLDIISWAQPNQASIAAYWRRGIGGRSQAWRPILQYQKLPLVPMKWPDNFVFPNYVEMSAVVSNMKESLKWPNQLPAKLIQWLLMPHEGLVLDLFMGTGTTGAVAQQMGLGCISVDASPQAFKVAKRRMADRALFEVTA